MTEINPVRGLILTRILPPAVHLLIVDDNPQNVELLQAFLESLP